MNTSNNSVFFYSFQILFTLDGGSRESVTDEEESSLFWKKDFRSEFREHWIGVWCDFFGFFVDPVELTYHECPHGFVVGAAGCCCWLLGAAAAPTWFEDWCFDVVRGAPFIQETLGWPHFEVEISPGAGRTERHRARGKKHRDPSPIGYILMYPPGWDFEETKFTAAGAIYRGFTRLSLSFLLTLTEPMTTTHESVNMIRIIESIFIFIFSFVLVILLILLILFIHWFQSFYFLA